MYNLLLLLHQNKRHLTRSNYNKLCNLSSNSSSISRIRELSSFSSRTCKGQADSRFFSPSPGSSKGQVSVYGQDNLLLNVLHRNINLISKWISSLSTSTTNSHGPTFWSRSRSGHQNLLFNYASTSSSGSSILNSNKDIGEFVASLIRRIDDLSPRKVNNSSAKPTGPSPSPAGENDKKNSQQQQPSQNQNSGNESSSSGGPGGPPNGDEEEKLSALLVKAFLWMLSAYMFIAFISLAFPGSNQTEVVRYVSWNEFVHKMLAKGEVEEIIVRPDINLVTIILYDSAVINGRTVEHKTFHMNIVDMTKFEEKLRLAEEHILGPNGEGGRGRVPIVYERSSDQAGKLLASLIIGGIILLAVLSRPGGKMFKPGSGSFMGLDNFMQMSKAKFTLVDTSKPASTGRGVRFADVAGLKEAKIEVMEFVDYLKKPDVYRNLGAKVPRGALLLGPPGCGKTMLAKAVATEAGVPFLSMNGSEFIEMIGGLGAARVRDLFKEATKRAPCIIYIDEIDAIGRKRSGEGGGGGSEGSGGTGETEQTLNQLLVEMDGMGSKEGVLILGSTNRADVLDRALLRPGRFDRHILIDLPTMIERREIFEQHLKGIKLDKKPQAYSQRLAELTPGFSGADIANVANEAALHGASHKKKVVASDDLQWAVERSVGGTEKRTQVMGLDERKLIAYHEAGRAIVSWMLKTTADTLLKITIVPRTSTRQNLGYSSFLPTDKHLYSQEELFELMCLYLGGRVAESLTFNRISASGKSEVDLQKVTKMAYAQIREYGMNDAVGLLSFDDKDNAGRELSNTKKPYSKSLGNLMDEEARKLVARAYTQTETILKENSEKLDKLAEELLKRETLSYEDVELLIGKSPYSSPDKKKSFNLEAVENVVIENETKSEESESKSSITESDKR